MADEDAAAEDEAEEAGEEAAEEEVGSFCLSVNHMISSTVHLLCCIGACRLLILRLQPMHLHQLGSKSAYCVGL